METNAHPVFLILGITALIAAAGFLGLTFTIKNDTPAKLFAGSITIIAETIGFTFLLINAYGS